MKNQELFHKTVGILVKAYQQETLIHGLCHACAVGNLIAANCGVKPNTNKEISRDPVWISNSSDFIRPSWTDKLSWGIIHDRSNKKAIEEILSTGYSINEVAMIERAFENVNSGKSSGFDNDGFQGLMSVVDALMLIHKANESEVLEAKSLFVKELAV